jgi:hypothetical protein
MSYSVDTYSGSRTLVVEDGTIDNSIDIKLIGKNYAGYGEVQNENFVHLLENFAGSSAPQRPLPGQIWYDTSVKKIKVYDAATQRWKATGGAESAATPPAGLSQGDIWYDTVNKQLYVFDGSTYVLVGPQGVSGLGTTQLVSTIVRDTSNGPRPIIKAVVGNSTIFVISKDEFDLHPDYQDSNYAEYIGGVFGTLKAGITSRNTANSDGVTNSGYANFWGTASAALGLVDGSIRRTASDFLLKTDLNFTNVVRFADVGYTLGDSNDLEVKIDADGTTPIFRTTLNPVMEFKTQSNTPLRLEGANILPGVTNTTDLGSTSLTFKDVYAARYFGSGANLTSLNASTFTIGTLPAARLSGTYTINIEGTATSAGSATSATRSDELKVGTVFRTASVDTASTGTANSIACRDADGNLNAVLFQGTATAALFADLAEKYLTDIEYEIGTVVAVGGDREVTACSIGDRAFGAVSGSPAYMMNAGLEGGTYIALKGRVPVKVVGPVRKGDKLVAADNGCAGVAKYIMKSLPITAGNFPDTFAIALESSDDQGVKLIESVIL